MEAAIGIGNWSGVDWNQLESVDSAIEQSSRSGLESIGMKRAFRVIGTDKIGTDENITVSIGTNGNIRVIGTEEIQVIGIGTNKIRVSGIGTNKICVIPCYWNRLIKF